MKINVKNKIKSKKLEDITKGECFLYAGNYYMKTDETNGNNDINVVNLRTGVLATLYLDKEVLPVEAEVIIHE